MVAFGEFLKPQIAAGMDFFQRATSGMILYKAMQMVNKTKLTPRKRRLDKLPTIQDTVYLLRHLRNEGTSNHQRKQFRTSAEIASLAARVLRDPNASETERSLAGSALVQRRQ
jgi:hypothetical protein